MRARRSTAGAINADLRETLHGQTFREIAEIEDDGAVYNSTVEHHDGDAPVIVDDNRKELRVWVKDNVSGHPRLATVVAASSALWRKPPDGTNVVELRGANTHGPGCSFVIQGDGGAEDDVPEELDDTNTVLSPPVGAIIIASRDGKLLLKAGGATIEISSGGKITATDDAGGTVVLEDGAITATAAANKNISVGVSGTGQVNVTATAAIGAVNLGPNPIAAPLVVGSTGYMGIPVTQLPAASASIVKSG